MQQVLDSHALMVYLEREPGYEIVRDALLRAAAHDRELLFSVVNWGEIYYIVYRREGEETAESVLSLLKTLPIRLVGIDANSAKAAAVLKATKKMSYADCFAAALAKIEKAQLLTGDPEFKEVEKEIKILWIK